MKADTCKHYNSQVFRRGPCDAGVDVRALVGGPDTGWMTRLPCITAGPYSDPKQGPKAVCELYQEPTKAEIAAFDAETTAAVDMMLKVQPLLSVVKKIWKKADWYGTQPCPVCGGTLHIRHCGFNGACAARCSTENCINLME